MATQIDARDAPRAPSRVGANRRHYLDASARRRIRTTCAGFCHIEGAVRAEVKASRSIEAGCQRVHCDRLAEGWDASYPNRPRCGSRQESPANASHLLSFVRLKSALPELLTVASLWSAP